MSVPNSPTPVAEAHRGRWRLSATVALCWLAIFGGRVDADEPAPAPLRIMTWNIWHGGREDGETVGPERVIDVIRESQADIVAMQETYGSGELISKALGFHFQPRGTNLSIHSRYPILEDISVFEPFKCVGSLIEGPDGRPLAVYCLWLPYGDDIWLPNRRAEWTDAELSQKCEASRKDLEQILTEIEQRLSGPKYQQVPVVIAGDFNSMSHLDYREIARDQYRHVAAWPTSQLMAQAGFRDAYRESHPRIDRSADATWSPRFAEQEQDRIDFVYYRSARMQARTSRVIREHPVQFPSDHAAVVTEFSTRPESPPAAPQSLTVASYNIRHGAGTDERVDLTRTAKVLKDLKADLIGLQEVDAFCRRSGQQNQAAELGDALDLHAAFGPFMDYDGGRYGMGILSRYPIVRTEIVPLPPGGEPRIALAVEVRLPSDETLLVVNIHLDWVRDDQKRLAQANALCDFLERQTRPFVLLGDFNDGPGSPTLERIRKVASEVAKPAEARLTFSSSEPRVEIDYLFVAPAPRWGSATARVVPAPVTSDHLPAVAALELLSEQPTQARDAGDPEKRR